MLETTAPPTAASQAVALLRAGVDALHELDLSTHTAVQTLDLFREIEVEVRRLATVDHAVINELNSRGVAGEVGCANTSVLVSQVLRIDPRDATRRVLAAADLGPRRALNGEPLPPVFEATAQACAVGVISPMHAQIITMTVDKLPLDVQATHDLEIESYLLEKAAIFTPREMRILARRLHDTYDQDGRLASDEDRARHRHITARKHADGTVSGTFHTDAITGEALLTFWDATAQPVSDDDGNPDRRNEAMRRHDALRDSLLQVLRSGTLPTTAGVTTTIVLTMTVEQLTGLTQGGQTSKLVETGHGALLGIETVRRLIADAQIQPVIMDKRKRIAAHGRSRRLFTQAQRLAMIARDKGCVMPGCTTGPARTEAHHVIEYSAGGDTCVENGCLLCSFHHREFERLGYRIVMIDGIPHVIAPPWLDPDQIPRRNTAHLPE